MSCWCEEVRAKETIALRLNTGSPTIDSDFECVECRNKLVLDRLTARERVKLKAYASMCKTGTFDVQKKEHRELFEFVYDNDLAVSTL